jgi:hypothetical protein
LVSNPWGLQAQSAFREAFEAWDKKRAILLWHWWKQQPDLVAATKVLLPSSDEECENDLMATLPPEAASHFREEILRFAQSRGWMHLHAAILAAASDLATIEKFRLQIEADPDPKSVSAIKLITDRAGSRELLAAALQLQDGRLLLLAGKAAAGEPLLMTDMDVSNPAWRSIWPYWVEACGELFEGIAEPAATAYCSDGSLFWTDYPSLQGVSPPDAALHRVDLRRLPELPSSAPCRPSQYR